MGRREGKVGKEGGKGRWEGKVGKEGEKGRWERKAGREGGKGRCKGQVGKKGDLKERKYFHRLCGMRPCKFAKYANKTYLPKILTEQ